MCFKYPLHFNCSHLYFCYSLPLSCTHSLSLSLSLSLYLSLTPLLSFSLPLSFTLSPSLSLSLSFFLPLTFSPWFCVFWNPLTHTGAPPSFTDLMWILLLVTDLNFMSETQKLKICFSIWRKWEEKNRQNKPLKILKHFLEKFPTNS